MYTPATCLHALFFLMSAPLVVLVLVLHVLPVTAGKAYTCFFFFFVKSTKVMVFFLMLCQLHAASLLLLFCLAYLRFSKTAVQNTCCVCAAFTAPFAGANALGSHHIVESMKDAFALRMQLGDPGPHNIYLDLDQVLYNMLSLRFANQLR